MLAYHKSKMYSVVQKFEMDNKIQLILLNTFQVI